eukprot:TRINITY_DN28203_c0_g1_i1.p1 TRINITY_DN28203_c0_g1~~TRINITY_DN28203_c0_g1_i1.p1  ORF type:complete len:415 (-),score=45.67 TRINITY_DN28203_c0_g1_i1:42-1286(-)
MRVNCSTCLELLTPGDNLVCTPCGHVFHMQCVLQWFESKKNCPQCRHSANEKNLRKIYLSEVDGGDVADPDDLQNRLDNALFKVRTLNTELDNAKSRSKTTDEKNVKLKEEIKKIEHSRRKAEDALRDIQVKITLLKDERDRFEQYKTDAEKYKREVEKFQSVDKVVKGSIGDVNMFLHERGCYDRESRDLALLIVVLKKTLNEVKLEKKKSDKKLEESHLNREDIKKRLNSQNVQISELKAHNEMICAELKEVKDQAQKVLAHERELKEKVQRQERALKAFKENELPPLEIDLEHYDEDEKNLSLSSMDSPMPSFKSCSVKIGEKRKVLSDVRNETGKRPRFRADLMQIGAQKSSGPAYDGMGGRSKPDVFPDPLKRKLSKPVKKAPSVVKLSNRIDKQQKQFVKYFGTLDSP